MRDPLKCLPGMLLFLALFSVHADWPEFRGPFGDGHVSKDDKPVGLPLHWSETNNIKWKTPVRYKGWSAPVVP